MVKHIIYLSFALARPFGRLPKQELAYFKEFKERKEYKTNVWI